MFQGHATVLENAEAENADPHLEEVRWQMGAKYAGGHGEAIPSGNQRIRYPMTAVGRSARWVVFEPDRLITWDNHKLAQPLTCAETVFHAVLTRTFPRRLPPRAESHSP